MIAEIRRIQIKLKFSFVAAITLMLYFCEERIVLSAFLASLIHEAGHLFFMMLYRAQPRKIEFGAFGICIERKEALLLSYKKEAVIALGGIIFNLAACTVSQILSLSALKDELMLFSAVNLLVAAFNSLPSHFLDMGRAVSFFLLSVTQEDKAEKIISVISKLTAIALTVIFIFYTAFTGFNVSLLAVTVYLNLITFKGKVEI